jgi:hypothetical protein
MNISEEQFANEKFISHNAGFNEGIKHSSPSPQTIKFMDKVNEQLKEIGEHNVKLDERLAYLQRDFTEMRCDIKKFIEEAENKFADKRVERIVDRINGKILMITGGSLVVLWVISTFGNYIINRLEK